MMTQAVEHASTTYQQPSFNRIFSADIQRLVSEKKEQEGSGSNTDLPSTKPDLENVQRLRNLLASEKTASFQKYLENLDVMPETNYSLWRAARNLKGRLNSSHLYAIQLETGHVAIVKR
ncbi:hypothetical protein EVAR_71985_1 [Eumeta japonica]|uniref:Uncharacterized protein n=1 Tax=Eumeta variegata TaxID=151549 RepID=A0A4C1T2K2_EUMVA|nr:hypothetical protein EVAR_71985_1 [Eumeta japonica]